MNREQRRAAQKAQHAHVAKLPTELSPVPKDQWPTARGDNPPFAVWWSRDFMVQVYSEAGGIVRLSVCRTKLAGDRWKDGIGWDDLQAIKNKVGYPDNDALEVYPASSDVVNVANMRHLWVMPAPVPFAWRKSNRYDNRPYRI